MMQRALPQIQRIDYTNAATITCIVWQPIGMHICWHFDNNFKVLNPEGFVEVEMQ